jgi:Lon protease-like protein
MSMNRPYTDITALPSILPIFPLAGVILFPRTQLPLNIFEPRYVQMIDDAMKSERLIGVCQPADSARQTPTKLQSIGTVGRITHLSETGDGRYSIVLTGVARMRLLSEEPLHRLYREFQVDYQDYEQDLFEQEEPLLNRKELLEALQSFATANKMKLDWSGIGNAPDENLVNAISMLSPLEPTSKQALLEAKSLSERSAMLIALTEFELSKSHHASSALQ